MITSIVQSILLSGKYQNVNGSAFLGLFDKDVVLYSLYESKDSNGTIITSFLSINLSQFVDIEEVAKALSSLTSRAQSDWAYLRLTDDNNVMYPEFGIGEVGEIYEGSDHHSVYINHKSMLFSVDIGIDISESVFKDIIDTGYGYISNNEKRERLKCVFVQDRHISVTDGYRLFSYEFDKSLTPQTGSTCKYYLPLFKEFKRNISTVLNVSGYSSDIKPSKGEPEQILFVMEGIMKHDKQQLFFQTGCTVSDALDISNIVNKYYYDESLYCYCIPIGLFEETVNASLGYYKGVNDGGKDFKVENVVCEFVVDGLTVESRTLCFYDSDLRYVGESINSELGSKCLLSDQGHKISYRMDCKYLSSFLRPDRRNSVVYLPKIITNPCVFDYGDNLKGLLMLRRV